MNRVLCECGCGGEVKPGNRFINGHNNRGDGYWKSLQPEQLCGCGCGKYAKPGNIYIRGHHTKVNNPFEGKHHTEEFKNGRIGNGNPNWRGGRYVDTAGYVRVLMKGHERSYSDGYMKEHILVWISINGDIPDGYCVHHINGDKIDNRIENLEMLTMSEHSSLHFMGNKFGQKYSDQTVLEWVELHRSDRMTYDKISKHVGVDKTTVFKRVKDFEKRFPLPVWASHQIYRYNGLLEDICEKHQVGHPNENWLNIHDPDGKKGFGIHGCDGCCMVLSRCK